MRGDPYLIERPGGWYILIEGVDGEAGPTTKEKAEAALADILTDLKKEFGQ